MVTLFKPKIDFSFGDVEHHAVQGQIECFLLERTIFFNWDSLHTR